MSDCDGKEHCCWFKGEVCQHLEENTVPGRRWACGLFRELGSWGAVIASDRYQKTVQPFYDEIPGLRGMNCADWPAPGKTCNECGVR